MTESTFIKIGPDIWTKNILSEIQLWADEAETVIGTMMMQWLANNGVRRFDPMSLNEFWTNPDAPVPAEMTFDPDMLIGIETVVCEEENPSDYVIIGYPGNVRAGDIRNKLLRRVYTIDFFMVKELGRLDYHEVRQTIEGTESHYRRLLLPVGNEQGVTRIHAVSRDMTVEVKRMERILQ